MKYYYCCISLLLFASFLLFESVSAYAEPPAPTMMVAAVEALHENCVRIYPELKAQYDSIYRMWNQSNKALLDQVRAMRDYETIRASLVRGFGEDTANPAKRKKACIKGLSVAQPQWGAELDLSLRYYHHETQVPASQMPPFMRGCIQRGLQRGGNPRAVNTFCSCTWHVIAADWTLREYADFQEHPQSERPQLVRIKSKLDQCKATETNISQAR